MNNPDILNPVDIKQIKSTIVLTVISVVILLLSLLLVYMQILGQMVMLPFIASFVVSILLLIKLMFLLGDSQIKILEDRIEVEEGYSVFAKLNKIKKFPKQQVTIEKIWTDDFASAIVELNKDNNKTETIFIYHGDSVKGINGDTIKAKGISENSNRVRLLMSLPLAILVIPFLIFLCLIFGVILYSILFH